jgi:hypothetical protein
MIHSFARQRGLNGSFGFPAQAVYFPAQLPFMFSRNTAP